MKARGWIGLSAVVLLAAGGIAWWRRSSRPAPVTVRYFDQIRDLPVGTRVAIYGRFRERGAGGPEPPGKPSYGIVFDGNAAGSFTVGHWVLGSPPAGVAEAMPILVVGTVAVVKGGGYATGLYVPGSQNDGGGGPSDMEYVVAEHVEIRPELLG